MAATWEPPPTLYQQLDAAALVFGSSTAQSEAAAPLVKTPGAGSIAAGGAAAAGTLQPAAAHGEGGDASQSASEGADGPLALREATTETDAAVGGSPAVVKSSRCELC